MSAPRLPPRLVALTPGTLADASRPDALLCTVAGALAAGPLGILLREPELGDRDTLALARALVALCARHPGAWTGVHDRVHVALAAGADAVHLGFRSLAPRAARELAAGRLAVGFSAHAGDPTGAEEGADYLFLGPVHDTPSKRGLASPLGLDGFAREARRRTLPVWAIGGLSPEHAGCLLASGARGIAVLSGLLGAGSPRDRARAYLAALDANDAERAR